MAEQRDAGAPGAPEDAGDVTFLHSRSLSDLDLVQANLVETDGRLADLFLRFVRETAALAHDEERLLPVLSRFTFEAFPQATHCVLVVVDPASGELQPLLVQDRDGGVPTVAISRTLVQRVMDEGVSVLYSEGQGHVATSDSIRLSRICAAICAPLRSRNETIGVLQLDIRRPGRGDFGRKEVDRLAVFAHHVALVLDNLRLHDEQRQALESTINALVHSLTLKDPDTAMHSERVQAISVHLGRCLGLPGAAVDALGVAAILHDMGKQGIRDQVLFKPARLTGIEREEMTRHTEYTEDILSKIRYPAYLKDVPVIAAYHHEKMNGRGPYGIPGDRIPIESRIIAVADVFDALLSARVYKKPMPLDQAFTILETGRDQEWDGAVIDALKREIETILGTVYGLTVDQARSRPPVEDVQARAA